MVIEVRGVSKKYGKTYALRNATFTVPRGSAAGLLGPNGSGKTTTLKILLGLIRRDSGDVSVLGMDPWVEGRRVRSRVGVLHERPVYPRDVRVSTLLRYIARLRRAEHDVKRIVSMVGLEKYYDSRIASLSRGYLQRLGLAVALLGDPEILLLDEPTANLDPVARLEILDLLKTLKRELNVTMLIASHIVPELERVCDSAIFISGGVVVDYGSLERLAKAYRVEAIVEFVCENPRAVAAELIQLEPVLGVTVRGGKVLARVSTNSLSVEKIAEAVGVGDYRVVSADLSMLYRRVVLGA